LALLARFRATNCFYHLSRINRWLLKDFKMTFLACCLLLFSLNCASQKHYTPRPLITEEKDANPIAKPKENKLGLYEDAIDKIFGHEIDEFVNIPWHLRKVTNNHKQAKNVNAFDEVPNSTWFANRNGKHRMSLEEIRRGPNRSSGPDVTGPFTIIGAKVQGVTPGCIIKDSQGDIYITKFDSKGFPQLTTAAEVITTKFVYAAGYNTPENYLCIIDPKQLRIGENVLVKNRWGRDVPMTFDYVQKILDKAEANPDGTYRVMASKLLDGEIVGPFRFNKVRKDDPNDHIPHHHRRELRGYKVIAAWLNIFDTKASNTLDVYVSENGKRFVCHYFIDFGTSLGSAAAGPAGRARGHEGAFDLGKMFLKIITLGLWVQPWEKQPRFISPSVGYFESKLFNPGTYKFIIPNPAFQKATELDGFWAAKIVMSFTDEQVRAVVETGKYSNPEDKEYVIKTLIERRDKTGCYWYSKVNPLDNFRFVSNDNDRQAIEFDDLAVKAGFQRLSETHYRYKLNYLGKSLTDYFTTKARTFIPIDSDIQQVMQQLFLNKQNLREEEKIFTFSIETKRGEHGSWGKYVKVHFYYPMTHDKEAQIIAIEREN
ncbi:MAG: hypothetical protein ACE5NG_03205, partial [bacterium]